MNWMTGLQRAIDYMEEHILEDLDLESIAAQSFSSSYHFQRVFSIVCDMTIGEYVRNRRLSLAGADLARGDVKVIDVAMKYGYDNPDSFARAFQRFHGVLPSQVKAGDATLLIWLPRHGINIGVDEFGWYLLVGIVINAYILCKREHNDHKTKKWNGLLFAKE